MAKQKVTLEVLSYHAAAPREDALKLMVNWIFACQLAHIEFFSTNWLNCDQYRMIALK